MSFASSLFRSSVNDSSDDTNTDWEFNIICKNRRISYGVGEYIFIMNEFNFKKYLCSLRMIPGWIFRWIQIDFPNEVLSPVTFQFLWTQISLNYLAYKTLIDQILQSLLKLSQTKMNYLYNFRHAHHTLNFFPLTCNRDINIELVNAKRCQLSLWMTSRKEAKGFIGVLAVITDVISAEKEAKNI